MVFIVVISSVLLAVCTSLKPIYLQNAIDAVDAGADGALTMFLCYVASILGILLFETARQLSTGKYRNSRLFSLKRKVMAHIVYMPPRKFQEEQGQNYVTTLNNEIEMLVDSYYVTRLELAYSILVLITCVIALLYINGYLAMIIIVSTVCPIVASAVQGKALEKRTNFYTMALEKLNVMIGNLIHGYPTIKVNHIEREYLQTLEQDNEKAAHAEFAKAKTKIRVNMIIGLLSYIGEAVMVGFSIYEISKGRLSVGALVGALQLSEMLVIPTNSISYQISEMRSVTGIRQKIQQLLAVPDSAAALTAAPTIEYMELDNVSFRHDEKVILSHANYRFEAGKKYLILGENGSGKSTLFKLLTGLETEYEGCISVNGTDIRQLWPALYDQIGVVLQDAFIFDDTFLRNVTLYRPALRERAISVMHSLGMDAFLASHDLDQVFQNTKGNLSGGERQKLALARVLTENKRVIFLDEATANMDKGSSQKILSQLLRTDGLTVISIEHKVSPELLPPKEGEIAQKTEDLVGPYELHDYYLYYMLRFGFTPRKIYAMALRSFAGQYDAETIKKWLKTFYRRFFQQQFKRSCLPDGPKVGSVTLSPRGDFRMPSDACNTVWREEIETL